VRPRYGRDFRPAGTYRLLHSAAGVLDATPFGARHSASSRDELTDREAVALAETLPVPDFCSRGP
jgi:hypothetical protein